MGIPDSFKKVFNTKPFTLENLKANFELFLQTAPFLLPAGKSVEGFASEVSDYIGSRFAKMAGKALTLNERILESSSSKLWGTLEDGTNQGVKHYLQYMDEYPDRIPGIARRLGIDASEFSKSVEGFENFTNQAVRVIKNGISKDVGGGKIYYYLETNAKEGVLVVTRDGKLQSMMSSNPKYFNKLVN